MTVEQLTSSIFRLRRYMHMISQPQPRPTQPKTKVKRTIQTLNQLTDLSISDETG